jgi:single-strand DNA-binding protein
MNLNKVFLFGNLTRDPELKSLPTGTQIASFGLATNRRVKRDSGWEDQPEFHNIVAFGKVAELVNQYMKKGSSLLVEGRIQTRSWEQDGQKKYRTEIIAETVQFGPRTGGGPSTSSGQGGERSAPASSAPAAKAPKEDAIEYPSEDINPEDIPF